jgi:hypothetical protein
MGNNQDLRKRIALYFDNELCQSEKSTLLEQVNQDPACCTMFEKEKTFREFIKNNISRPQVSSELIFNLKSKLSKTDC